MRVSAVFILLWPIGDKGDFLKEQKLGIRIQQVVSLESTYIYVLIYCYLFPFI